MSDVFGTAISGLHAAQYLMETAAHNIANANTPGYSRQTTNLQSAGAELLGKNYFGHGVKLGETKRIVDLALVGDVRDNSSTFEYWDIQQTYAQNLNELLTSNETSLNGAFDGFFNAINELSTQAAGSGESVILLERVMTHAQNLATSANRIADQINITYNDLYFDINSSVEEINSTIAIIADLNNQVKAAQLAAQGGQPNDLQDARDAQLRELAKLVDVKITYKDDYTVDVYLPKGYSLISGSTFNTFSVERDPYRPQCAQVILTNAQGKDFVVDHYFAGGKTGGLLYFQNQTLQQAEADINKLIVEFGVTMNAQHKLGMDSEGLLGKDLFTDFNDLPFQLARSMYKNGNLGTAVLKVAIDVPPRQQVAPYSVTSSASALTAVGTLGYINSSQLRLNNFQINAPTAADDTVSPAADRQASAIALANVINASVGNMGISAKANINVVNLGTFTNGALNVAPGNFNVNGTDISSTGTSSAVIVEDINSQTYLTGVRAELDASNNVLLIADDGRNIQITANGTGTGTFQYFTTTVANGAVARASVTITGVGDELIIGGTSPSVAGLTAQTYPVKISPLTNADYTLSYNGSLYTLVRQSDDEIVYLGTNSTISVDGFTLSVANGTMVAGDEFTIRPTINAARSLALKVPTVKQLAFASPLKITNPINNAGTAKLKLDKVLDTSGLPAPTATTYGNAFYGANNVFTPSMTPPIQIKFFDDPTGNATLYEIYDMTNPNVPVQIGPKRIYTPGIANNIFPLSGIQDANNAPYTWDPGYRISLTGLPKAGDTFSVGLNDGKSNYSNATEFYKMQSETILDSNSITYQGFYAQFTSTVAIKTQGCKSSASDAGKLLKICEDRVSSYSGVNMDDEYANILRFQQYYAAAAQILSVQRNIMATLIDAFR